MKNVYIINSSSVGADYGIGTYIRQISEYINSADINLTFRPFIFEREGFQR